MTPAYDGALGEMAAGHETLSSPLDPGPDHRHHLPLVGVLHHHPQAFTQFPPPEFRLLIVFIGLKKMVNDQKKVC